MSLYVQFEAENGVKDAFAKMWDGGQMLMPLATYPFGKKFARVTDKFGVSRQLTMV
jgi:uncharacterized glyoxalase superfamily protein PhnB